MKDKGQELREEIAKAAALHVFTRLGVTDPAEIDLDAIAAELNALCKHHVGPNDAVERLCSPLHVDGKTTEREADVFAAELLMPRPLVTSWCAVAPLTFDPVRAIASAFGTSVLASAMRYVELTPERCAVVYTKQGRVQWAKKSPSFSAWIPKRAVAPGSAAYDYHERGSIGESSRIVPGTTWLSSKAERVDAPIYEHATAVPGLGAVFSLLWLPPAGNVPPAQGT